MSARRRRDNRNGLGQGIALIVLIVGAVAYGWYGSNQAKEKDRKRAAAYADADVERTANRLRSELADHERDVMKLARTLSFLQVSEEVPCPMQLGEIYVGQKAWLRWISMGRYGERGDAPGTQSLPFDHAADRISILHPDPVRRSKELGALLAAEYVAVAVPTEFVQARRAAEAPGFTGGTFHGYLAVVSLRDLTVVCSAKLDVQLESVLKRDGQIGTAELDDYSNWETWKQPFRRDATAALRRIGGPRAAMAE